MTQKIDRTGQRFGRLTVLAQDTQRAGSKLYWLCQCDCGRQVAVSRNNLQSGTTTSCGCYQRETAAARQRKRRGVFADLTGQQFGRLRVLSYAGEINGKPFWNCLCTCGTMRTVMAQSLRQGRTLSCGCYQREDVRRRSTKHGRAGTAAYKRIYRARREDRQGHLDVGWTRKMDQLLRRLQPACVICGATEPLTVDHVRPLSKGYGLVPGNAAILCGCCNSTKFNKDLEELPPDWLAKIAAAAENFRQAWENL